MKIPHHKKFPEPQCSGFTLIELLITISIIAILAGLLLPVLNSVKAKGQAISCVSNMKQLGTLFMEYANDFDGYMLSMTVPVKPEDGGPYYSFSDPKGYFVNFYVDKNSRYKKDPGNSALFAIASKRTILTCPVISLGGYPSDLAPGNYMRNNKWTGLNATYIVPYSAGTYYSSNQILMDEYPPVRLARLRNPSRFPHLYEGRNTVALDNRQDQFVNPTHTNCNVHYRHRSQTNVLYTSGGVKTVRLCRPIVGGHTGDWSGGYEAK